MIDGALALVFVVVGQLDVWHGLSDGAGGHPHGSRVAASALMVLLAVPIAVRRSRPLMAVCLMSLSIALQAALYERVYTLAGLIPMLIAAYSVSTHGRSRAARVGGLAAAVVAGTTINATVPAMRNATGFVFDLIVLGLAWSVGWLVRTRSERATRLVELARQLEHERDERAREAVLAEQARIARELHDVIAHAVSVMVIQAGAAEQVLGNDASMRSSLASIRQAGGEALAELRRLVGILRDHDEQLSLAPQPGIADLAALAAQASAAGLAAELRIDGDARPLPPGLELTAYRIVQEALTNIRKHAATSTARICISFSPNTLSISIVNENAASLPSSGNGGHGLIGMRERASLYGGTLTAGPRPGGGFAVEAELPLPGTRT